MEPETRASAKGGKGVLVAVVVLILLVAAGALAYTQGWIGGAPQGKTVAVVNGTEIKEKEMNARFEQLKPAYESQGVDLADATVATDIKKKIVDEIVNEELVLQHAANQGVVATDEDVESAFGQLQARFQTADEFQAELKANNLSERDLRQNLRRELVIQKYIEQFAAQQNITATEEEVNQLYQNLSQGQENAPALADVRTQVEQEVKRQKLAEKIVALVAELKQSAQIQILL